MTACRSESVAGRRLSAGCAGKPRCARQNGLTASLSTSQKHEQHRWPRPGEKATSFLQQGRDTFDPIGGHRAPVLFSESFIHSQMNLLESLLLMRTSSSRSLALTCLYSLYSTASGERSSFCTFLWERDNKQRKV